MRMASISSDVNPPWPPAGDDDDNCGDDDGGGDDDDDCDSPRAGAITLPTTSHLCLKHIQCGRRMFRNKHILVKPG